MPLLITFAIDSYFQWAVIESICLYFSFLISSIVDRVSVDGVGGLWQGFYKLIDGVGGARHLEYINFMLQKLQLVI